MFLSISYAEITAFISRRYGKNLELSQVSEREICVAYEQSLFISSIKVPINLRIEEVRADEIVISYSGKLGIDKAIEALLKLLRGYLDPYSFVVEEGRRIRIVLSNLKQAKKFVENVALEDIRFTSEGVNLSAVLK